MLNLIIWFVGISVVIFLAIMFFGIISEAITPDVKPKYDSKGKKLD